MKPEGDVVRLGILGTGRIAERFVLTGALLPQNYRDAYALTAVYNPRRESSERFAAAHGIDTFFDQLPAFLSAVDAVYIATPHETHAAYAREALLAGKHVLCEKPMALKKSEAEELFSLAEERGLVLMEAVKTAYLPGFLELMDCALSGTIGEIVDVEAAFTRLTTTQLREMNDLSFGGSFTELGSYGLLPVLFLLGCDRQDAIFFTRDLANGLDAYAKAILDFGERTATVKTGLGVKSEGQLLVSGTKGYILAESPWWLTKKFVVRYEDPGRVEEHTADFEGSGMQYELAVFLDAVKDAAPAGCPEPLYKMISIVSASVMEQFLASQEEKRKTARQALAERKPAVRLWAHRGCSMAYPENTLPAFRAAAELGKGLTGIELDIQRTADGELVVIHDETVDRVTTGHGAVREMTLAQLKGLAIKGAETDIPSFSEVLALLKPYCEENGLKINVELKTSVVRYEGIEEQAYAMVRSFGLEKYIVWSSFLADSIRIIKEIDPAAETGMLARELERCVRDGDAVGCDAYHPWIGGLGWSTPERAALWREQGRAIRAYNSDEPLFGSGRVLKATDLRESAVLGVTDLFTNVPERYLQ